MLRFLTAGESHGPSLTAILDGMPAGLKLNAAIIDFELARRQKGFGSGARMKIERDSVQILGGVMAGETTGAPITVLVQNMDHARWKARAVEPMTAPRPGHADLTGAVKYAYQDLRPALERASARETTVRVAVGAVCKHFLAQFGITVGGYVRSIGEVEAELSAADYRVRFEAAEQNEVRCPDQAAAEKMRGRLEEIIRAKDTLGGILEIVALNVPVGLGSFSQWDKRLEARLAMALMSVQAIKGVEFGDAFENARRLGTQVHDSMTLERSSLQRSTNRAGGIEGGISNGQPIVMRAAMKPIATTLTPQHTVDLASGQESPTKYERSDFCPVPRAVPILESMAAFVLADALIEKLGGDSLGEMLPRFAALRKARLEDLKMDNTSHVFWE
ncbi:MAG TPA: chorismate synthase [Anaerolineales bacterium]|nr:chorismate synthase [Anaerolineales bacterium]